MASPAPVTSLWKVLIGGVSGTPLDFYTNGFEDEVNVIVAEDGALGDTQSTLFFFASESDVVPVKGKVYTAANLALLQAAAINFTTIAITNEFGATYISYKIMGLNAMRVDALNFVQSWHEVSLDLLRL